eukprot:11428456-Alexandrium_andersonii.AAC.1
MSETATACVFPVCACSCMCVFGASMEHEQHSPKTRTAGRCFSTCVGLQAQPLWIGILVARKHVAAPGVAVGGCAGYDSWQHWVAAWGSGCSRLGQ